jgi:hypothetical protein
VTPEEIEERLDDTAFMRRIFALAATQRPDNPSFQRQHDAATAIVTLSWEIKTETLPEKDKATLLLKEMMVSYVLDYGQNPE